MLRGLVAPLHPWGRDCTNCPFFLFGVQAREAQIQAKVEELEIVREMVNRTRYISHQSSDVISEESPSKTVDGHTCIDLHGATVVEATQIVQDMVFDDPPTNGEGPPLPLPYRQLSSFNLQSNL